jgi:hypothetical protein
MTHLLPSPARLQLLLDMCDRAAARLQARHEAGQHESASLRPQAGRPCAAPGKGAALLLGQPAGGSSWPPAGAVGVVDGGGLSVVIEHTVHGEPQNGAASNVALI